MTKTERKRMAAMPDKAKAEFADMIFEEISSKTVKASWRDPATKIAFAKFVEMKVEHFYFNDWQQQSLSTAESILRQPSGQMGE